MDSFSSHVVKKGSISMNHVFLKGFNSVSHVEKRFNSESHVQKGSIIFEWYCWKGLNSLIQIQKVPSPDSQKNLKSWSQIIFKKVQFFVSWKKKVQFFRVQKSVRFCDSYEKKQSFGSYQSIKKVQSFGSY